MICSISLVGFGMMAAIMPLISPEKGQQVTYIFSAVLLLISGIYYSIDVLPGWMQPLAKLSPIYYTLNGIRAMLLDGASFTSQWANIWPLLIMGVGLPAAGAVPVRKGRALREGDWSVEAGWVVDPPERRTRLGRLALGQIVWFTWLGADMLREPAEDPNTATDPPVPFPQPTA